MNPTHIFRCVCIALSCGLASCYPPPITEVPQGTFHINPAHIPEGLDTDDLLVTVDDGLVVFHWTDSAGEAHEVTYTYDYEPPIKDAIVYEEAR